MRAHTHQFSAFFPRSHGQAHQQQYSQQVAHRGNARDNIVATWATGHTDTASTQTHALSVWVSASRGVWLLPQRSLVTPPVEFAVAPKGDSGTLEAQMPSRPHHLACWLSVPALPVSHVSTFFPRTSHALPTLCNMLTIQRLCGFAWHRGIFLEICCACARKPHILLTARLSPVQ